jgi:predicted dehydrogenase
MGYGVHRIDTILRFGEHAIGEITINWTVKHAPWKDLLFRYGEQGSIHNAFGRLETDGTGHRSGGSGMSTVDVPAADSFAEQLAHFVTCVADGREPLTSGAEARRTLAVCLAAYQSAETGMVVQPVDARRRDC